MKASKPKLGADSRPEAPRTHGGRKRARSSAATMTENAMAPASETVRSAYRATLVMVTLRASRRGNAGGASFESLPRERKQELGRAGHSSFDEFEVQ